MPAFNLKKVETLMLTLARDTASELYWEGKPRRGASHRAAFWDGYMGNRSGLNIPGTITAACYRAGQRFAKEHPGLTANYST